MSARGETIHDGVIDRAAVGERDAQRQIYEFYGSRVYQTVERIVGGNDAADVMQDAFLHLFNKLSSYRHEAAFTTWLHRLVINEALQHLRRREQRALKTQTLSQHALSLHDIAAKDQTSCGRDVLDLLSQAMDRLEPELRLIFQLKAIDELS